MKQQNSYNENNDGNFQCQTVGTVARQPIEGAPRNQLTEQENIHLFYATRLPYTGCRVLLFLRFTF